MFEHRFSGGLTEGSYPFVVNSTTGMAESGYGAYKYLNTEQAFRTRCFLQRTFNLLDSNDTGPLSSYPPRPGYGSVKAIQGCEEHISESKIQRSSMQLGLLQPPRRAWSTYGRLFNSSCPICNSRLRMCRYWAQAERSMTRNCSADYTRVTK